MLVNKERLLATFRQLLLIDSPSGQESDITRYLTTELISIGGKVLNDTNGNIIAHFNGEGEPILLSAHMDTIQSTRGIKIIETDDRWQTDGTTILGADDKAGLAAILEVVRSIREKGIRHKSIEAVFTINEEIMMGGARRLDYGLLSAKTGIGLDTRGPATNMVISAPAFTTIEVVIKGQAAHAGTSPELGINAIVVAAEAIAQLPWGRINEETTTNVGVIHGGVARNIVPETVAITAEVRSLNELEFKARVNQIAKTFQDTANRHGAITHIDLRDGCPSFKVDMDTRNNPDNFRIYHGLGDEAHVQRHRWGV